MPTIRGQVLASTCIDSQGERFDKAFLDELAAKTPGRMPLNQQHEMKLPTVGFVENLRVQKIPDSEDWELVGDVTYEGTAPALGGFSFSTTRIVHRATAQQHLSLYVSFPHY